MKTIQLFLLLGLSEILSSQLSAQSKIWNGSLSTDWSTPANWTPAVLPARLRWN